jgi:5-methylthioribose kinase
MWAGANRPDLAPPWLSPNNPFFVVRLPALEDFLRLGCTFSRVQDQLTESNVFEYLRGRLPDFAEAQGGAPRCEPAGDGNINWVRRVRAGERSVVVKQAGPALAKFPEYAASPERILHEARYYAAVAPFDPGGVCPTVLDVDAVAHALVLEDIAPAERLDAALRRGADTRAALCEIAAFLGRVHAGVRDAATLDAFPDGATDDGVLALHLDHVFRLPFAPNDFPLSPALRAAAEVIWSDTPLRTRIAEVEAHCRTRGRALVHGDVQPTNILLSESGAKLLDAEIAHAGDPRFDLGMLVGHLVLADVARGRPDDAAERVAPIWRAYCEARGDGGGDFAGVAAVAGVEILRRTIGAARVPDVERDAAALRAVEAGRRLVVAPPADPAQLHDLEPR